MLSPVCLSIRLTVRLSVTRVDQSKMVEVRIMQLSLQSSPMTACAVHASSGYEPFQTIETVGISKFIRQRVPDKGNIRSDGTE